MPKNLTPEEKIKRISIQVESYPMTKEEFISHITNYIATTVCRKYSGITTNPKFIEAAVDVLSAEVMETLKTTIKEVKQEKIPKELMKTQGKDESTWN